MSLPIVNQFDDIGIVRPGTRMFAVVHGLRDTQEKRLGGLTQTKAAALLGIPQPKLSKMLRGQFRGFSERKLMDCLTLLGRDIDIVVRTTPKRKGQGAVSVSFA